MFLCRDSPTAAHVAALENKFLIIEHLFLFCKTQTLTIFVGGSSFYYNDVIGFKMFSNWSLWCC